MKKLVSFLFILLFCLLPNLVPLKIYAIDCTEIGGIDTHQEGDTWPGVCSGAGKRTQWICPIGNNNGQPITNGDIDDPICRDASGAGGSTTVSGKGVRGILGQIKPPDALLPFIQQGGNGAGGISLFITNLIILIFIIGSVVFVFIILWGAWDFLTSGGEKEKVAGARNRIFYAIIGLILFSLAFAIINIVQEFTGFHFIETPSNGAPGDPPPPL